MAHFTKIRPGGWVSLSTLGADEMQTLDGNLYKAINGDDGGAWQPSSRIVIGGSGIGIYDASITIGDGASQPGVFVITSGSLGGLESGATWSTASGSTTNLNGTTSLGGHNHHVVSGGWLTVDPGALAIVKGTLEVGVMTTPGTLMASVASVVDFYGNAANGGGTTFKSASTTTQESAATLSLHGDTTLESDGSLRVDGTVDVYGPITVQSGGVINTTGTGAITVATGGALNVNAGATSTFNGTLAGSITRTAAVTRSGSTANEYLRVASGGAGGGTYTPTFDILFSNIIGDSTYVITDGTDGQVIRIAVNGLASGPVLTIADSAAATVARLDPAVCTAGAHRGLHVDIVWHGGTWRAIGGYGLVD